MKVSVIGTGYVGLVTAACLAEVGNELLCVDLDAAKIAQLQRGQIPIHEPGLAAIVARNAAAGRLEFTTDAARAVAHGLVQMIAVGTPPGEDGAADLAQVLQAARTIGAHMDGYRLVVTKSTVPVGTADAVHAAVGTALRARGAALPYAVVSNPEFLKEGAAVDDFVRPDRIIVGADDEQAVALMRALYAPFQRNHDKLLVMDPRSAELSKYAANAMLATRISFMNELALLADRLGADIEWVRRGIGSDPRIGPSFLYAGAGFGGSCFPKDTRALLHSAHAAGVELRVLAAVQAANQRQKQLLFERIAARFGGALAGRRFALWGLAFKPDTDDLREAPSLVLIDALLAAGAQVLAYDPAAAEAARRHYAGRPGPGFAPSALAAAEGADALVIVTEWKEFRSPDFERLRALLRTPLVFDGRNLWDPALPEAAGLEYHAIGRRTAASAAYRSAAPAAAAAALPANPAPAAIGPAAPSLPREAGDGGR